MVDRPPGRLIDPHPFSHVPFRKAGVHSHLPFIFLGIVAIRTQLSGIWKTEIRLPPRQQTISAAKAIKLPAVRVDHSFQPELFRRRM
jgi:hypothetical protein